MKMNLYFGRPNSKKLEIYLILRCPKKHSSRAEFCSISILNKRKVIDYTSSFYNVWVKWLLVLMTRLE